MATSKKTAKASIDKANSPADEILVCGARTHNLKNVTVSFPRNKLIVVTGVSGSGKSSLTIDTLFAEGQRRYAESLSAYARQFMSRMVKPDVDYIKGLCPAIAIEQKVITRTPRSTVGSMTEIYDYLRLLFARVGKTISPISGKEVKKDEVADVMHVIAAMPAGTKMVMLVAFKQHEHRAIREELSILMQKGFSRMFLMKQGESGLPERIEDILSMSDSALAKHWKTHQHNYYVLIDRMVVKEFEEDDLHRLADSIGTAFFEGHGEMLIEINSNQVLHFSNKFEADGMQFEEPSPNLFSFNNPYGACAVCEGFGQVLGIDKDLVIPDRRLSLYENAIAPWKGEKMSWWKDQFIKGASKSGFPIHKPIMDLTKEQYQQLWTGVGTALGINDFFKEVEQNLYKVQYRVLLSRYRGRTTCHACDGFRLRNEALYVKIHGKHIGELCNMQVSHLKNWFDTIPWSEQEQAIGKRILTEINQRVKTLLDVGLGYLTLERLANTLSGGESQRIQLTRNLGSNLTNSLYILDEPSIGLHSRDTQRLIGVLKSLRDLGNTVVVVEHDEMMMREADHIIDMGPLASHLGGEVVAAGDYNHLIKDKNSLTGKYLTGELAIQAPSTIRKWNSFIRVEGARQHNLKDITVDFPLHCFCVVAGVSGSGKTTLIKQILYPGLQKIKGEAAEKVGLHKAITGDIDSIAQIEMIDQQPIGKSSRSNPVTYIKAYDAIRDLFSKQGLAKMRGFQPKHFSFNVDGGRCDTCKGEGETVVEMQFLADVHLTCESCGGKRFKEEVLEIKYNNASIHDILEMSVDEAFEFFKEEKQIQKAIKTLQDVGLGYIKLGQSSNTLSGGEAQRVKLASFLGKGKGIGHVLFIFDEPTTGLHFHDIQKLLNSFNALIEQGHSLIVIEHNTDVLKSADWLIELGPEAGNAGGELVYAGLPADLKKNKKSITAPFI
ncbi:excinuclease ABC subunit UvrA [Sediminibacterium sp.]|uniref:excinuclease ABC subunit UvrA n=1 Tax=Sediminibacterium sp. TaxID=1917865 RepID=UPI003F72186B